MQPFVLSDTLSAAISAKCGAIQSQTMVWERSLAKAGAAGVSDETLLLLLEGFESSRALDGFVAGGDGADKLVTKLRALVDASDFDWSAWLAAFERVHTHLAARGRSASPSSIVGYVQCSAEMGGASEIRRRLPEVVSEMLEHYGFEGQEGCGVG